MLMLQSLLRTSVLPLQISTNLLASSPLQTQILLQCRPMPHHHTQQVHQLCQTHLSTLTNHSLLSLPLALHSFLALVLLASRFLIRLEETRSADYTIGIIQFLTEYSGGLVVVGQGMASGGSADEAVLVCLDFRHVYIYRLLPPIIGSNTRNPQGRPPCAL